MEEIKDPVMLLTTNYHSGKEKVTGPWERGMLERWLLHCELNCSNSEMKWELKEIGEIDG